jgi:N-methylhydantoinase A/oxoprolinase/acetone carboxylase beta subunit
MHGHVDKTTGTQICIDNGGTLTDICVFDQGRVYFTKTLTTPYDLSECFFDGLRKVSAQIYGHEDVEALLRATEHVRYSTTQGTNSLVERKGPLLGLILPEGFDLNVILEDAGQRELFDAIVGDRVGFLTNGSGGSGSGGNFASLVNTLTGQGASRLVVCLTGDEYVARERELIAHYDDAFPSHMLGTVPAMFSHEVVDDWRETRRIWTTVLNAFLHDAMETFLFNAQRRLRNTRSKSPFLIFRNDGGSARVAKTTAIKTYGSGPRGGMEAVCEIARTYGFDHTVSVDIGGTTADIGTVTGDHIAEDRRGTMEGVPVSFGLPNIVSLGVGGSSIFRVVNGKLKVGPESVGAAPGPACFGLGGTEATITDAYLVLGILDPQSFFGGTMALDRSRAEAAILKNVAEPLGVPMDAACFAMEQAWIALVAQGLVERAQPHEDTVLTAFGGAGPMVICRIAEAAGIRAVLVPGLAAGFCAYGIGYTDVSQHYEVALIDRTAGGLEKALKGLVSRAERDMHAEGFALEDCQLNARVALDDNAQEIAVTLDRSASWPPLDNQIGPISVVMTVVAPLRRPTQSDDGQRSNSENVSGQTRIVTLGEGNRQSIPVLLLAEQGPGTQAEGPAVIEHEFFTCLIPDGWALEVRSGGDVMLIRQD